MFVNMLVWAIRLLVPAINNMWPIFVRAWSEGTHKYYLNQFPFEMVITIKNLLAAVARRVIKRHIDHDTLESKLDWLPITFNLTSELAQFVSYFQQRKKRYVGIIRSLCCIMADIHNLFPSPWDKMYFKIFPIFRKMVQYIICLLYLVITTQ